MNSIYFMTTERSDSTIRHSSFDIRHSNVVSQEDSAPRFPATRNPKPDTRQLKVFYEK